MQLLYNNMLINYFIEGSTLYIVQKVCAFDESSSFANCVDHEIRNIYVNKQYYYRAYACQQHYFSAVHIFQHFNTN